MQIGTPTNINGSEKVSIIFKYTIIIYNYYIIIRLVYRSEGGSVYLLPVVKKAEKMVLDETLNHNYLPLLGIEEFSKSISTLVLGNIEKQWKDGTV